MTVTCNDPQHEAERAIRNQVELARTTGYGIDPRRHLHGVCWHGIFADDPCSICDSGGPQRACIECDLLFRDGDRIFADARVEPPILRHRDCRNPRGPAAEPCLICAAPIIDGDGHDEGCMGLDS